MSTFYTIAEIAQQTGLSAHTLRYYERIGLIDDVARNDGQHRRYNAEDLRWLEFLQRLRSTKMSIAQMLCYAQLRRSGNQLESLSERRTMLEQHVGHLNDEIALLQDTLLILNQKISAYIDMEKQAKSAKPLKEPPCKTTTKPSPKSINAAKKDYLK
jgi:DNA-binding transcriptional MerR regulator